MIKEKYYKLPDFIKEKYDQEVEFSQPIKILEHIVFIGKKYWASDVHITGVIYDENSLDNLVAIKFRIDNDLDNYIYNLSEEIRSDPKSYITMWKFANTIRWIKTSIWIGEYNETEIPQDAAYKFEHYNKEWEKIDETKVRINSMPIWIDIIWKDEVWVHQSLVLRIINDYVDSLPKYEELWIMPIDKQKLNNFLKSQKGALINSWPTGSWKSVTMQVLLSQIASEDIKIHTLEDPIEYRNPLLIQTQINISKWFTWNVGIRALMRQDPDIIMVWEVRDEDSAELFVESSLTWHMWFTTTHAKTWCWAFDRLKLMWVKPYLIVWWITISMSQRLAQKLCSVCKIHSTDPVIKEKLAFVWDDKFTNFDFTILTPDDICMMIWDDQHKMYTTFSNLFKQFNGLKTKILNSREESEKIELKQKLVWLNKQLFHSLKEHFINNFYERKVTKEWEKICLKCQWKWVKWRIWAFEFIETTKEIEQLVLDDVPLKHMEDHVRKSNIFTLDRHWIVKAMRGEIDMIELLKLL